MFPTNTTKAVIISITLIVILSYGIFFYLQNNTEANIRNTLFKQQQQRQIESTKSLSQHIGADLAVVMSKLETLANSAVLQQGNLSETSTSELLERTYREINSITPIDRLFILDNNNILSSSVVEKNLPKFEGVDFSIRDWAVETKNTLMPVFSNGFKGMDGIYRIALTFPIVNKNTGEYLGMVAASLPTVSFFEHYGNIYDIRAQYLAVLDRNAIQLIHPVKTFIGTSFFGNYTQEATGHNSALNNIIRTVISGKPYFDTYEFRNGERLNTGFPVLVGSEPKYSVFVITPTSTIFSQINDVIYTQRIEILSLLAGMTAAVGVLIIFLIRWNTNLNNEVKRRTSELNEFNQRLSQANQQLKVHDKMQREFINVAAHELRTPIQPILGLSEILYSKEDNAEKRKLVDVISRNAKRLQILTEDILDVTRIESRSLKLSKEKFNLNDVIVNCLNDVAPNGYSTLENGNVKISYEPRDIYIQADKGRIAQVVSNLLGNAKKFTQEGSISITSEKKDSQAIVRIKDTGSGIDSDLFSRLFTKFASKSFQGTGLGLFIAKSIVEAHGGRIWAENNTDVKGATFGFSLPIQQ